MTRALKRSPSYLPESLMIKPYRAGNNDNRSEMPNRAVVSAAGASSQRGRMLFV